MKKLIVVCAALLLVQLALAAFIHLRQRPAVTGGQTGPLLHLNAAEVQELLLENGAGKQLTLNRDGEGWRLPGLDNFPADASRVQGLLDRLLGAQHGWPEATTTEAANRFKVAADRFEHRLTLRGGGKDLGRVFFGSSPGLRKVYLRVDGDSHIQTLTLETGQLDLSAEAWIDTGLLRFDSKQAQTIELPGLRLVRQGEALQPADLQTDEEPVRERVDALVRALAELRISTVLGQEARAEYGLDQPALQCAVELQGGRRIDYRFGQEKKPDQPTQTEATGAKMPAEPGFVLKVSGHDRLFRVHAWQVEEIRSATRAALVKPKVVETAGQPAKEAPASKEPGR
jgi:hypothetical protein